MYILTKQIRQNSRRRRVLSALLAACMLLTLSTPLGGAAEVYGAEGGWPAVSEQEIVDMGIGETALLGRTGTGEGSVGEAGAGAGEAPTAEAGLFQSADGTDFRTYATDADWYLGIAKLETTARLYTEKQSTDYGGAIITNKYENLPNAGMRFVVVNLALTKTVAGGANFAADKLCLTIGGNSYQRILDDSFLTNHDYTTFPNTEILAGSRTGDVVFEVSEADAAALSDWKAAFKAGTLSLKAGVISADLAEADDDELIQVPMENQEVEKQYKTEREIMETFRAGSYPLESPLFLQNIYGNAPLSGVVLFTTDEDAASIEVTAKGRHSSDDDITYSVDTTGKEHQAPVIGLYKDGVSNVELRALNKNGGLIGSKTISVTTPSNSIGQLRTSISDVYKSGTIPMEPGLTALGTTDMAVIDSHGDVRWFRNAEYTTNPASGNKLTDRGTILCSNHKNGTSANPTIFYEMNWLGKILGRYLIDDQKNLPDLHHETNESWDGTQMLYCFNETRAADIGIRTVDLQTGAILDTTYVSEFLKKGSGDWAHQNTITPTHDGHTYLLSFRHLDLVCKYDSLTKQIVWAFSKNKAKLLSDNPKLAGKFIDLKMDTKDQNDLAPEYFDHQHHVTPLDYTDGRQDCDGDPNTEDILLFDNGNDKGHSRIVRYRIDTVNHTAVQVFSYGKDDSGFNSDMWGSSCLLPKTGHYLGTASCNRPTEVTASGEVVFRAKASEGTYRAFRILPQKMADGFQKLGTVKGKAFNKVGYETQFVKTELDRSISGAGTQSISQIYLYENQLVLRGSAYLTSGAKKSVFLVADDGKNQYYAPLLSNSTADAFNNIPDSALPISIDRLPAGRYSLGILVDQNGSKAYKQSNYYIKKTGSLEVSQTEDGAQREIVDELLAKSRNAENTAAAPAVSVNPFGNAPLSAIAAFYTQKACEVKVTVKGKPASGDAIQADVSYTVSGKTQNHVVPIIGLFGNYENTVILEAGEETSTIQIKTGEVNRTYTREAEVTATAAQRSEAVPGLTFLTPAGAQTVPMAIDVNGELRWAYICPSAAPVETKPLSDGHFLVLSDRPSTGLFVTDAESALEIDLTGRVYAEYFLDGMPHHEVHERGNGNLIFALSKRNSVSLEDYMVEIERSTGRTVRTWDFRKILGIPEYDPSYDPEKNGMNLGADSPDAPHRAQPNVTILRGNHAYSDWFHQNSLYYDEGNPDDPADDAIYVTGRHQSALIKVNAEKAAGEEPETDAIEWIYTDPSWLPQSARDLKSLLLKPEGAPAVSAIYSAIPSADAALNDTEEIGAETAAAKAGGEAGPNAAGASDETEDSDIGPETSDGPEAAEEEHTDQSTASTAAEASEDVSEDYYVYGPHAVEQLENGDLILYDNNLYGGKTTKPPAISADNPAAAVWEEQQGLYSRAVRLRVDEESKTFRIVWEYGRELKTSHYTPFIGDVDYLGGPGGMGGPGGEDDHYLVDFGGITKIDGMACDVMAAMTAGGTISADIREVVGNGDQKTVLWSAYLKGETGKVSSAYRAERVDLKTVPFSASDYAEYTGIENRGAYRNTPQAGVSASVIDGAARGRLPISWSLLKDEGNRLLGKFTLTEKLSKTLEEVFVILDMGKDGWRVYASDYVAASPTFQTDAYYGFEIVKDNKAARIQLLLHRKDGRWVLGETGETASAAMQYVTGEVPVIDAVKPTVEARNAASAPLLTRLAASAGYAATGTMLLVEKGALPPGMKYVYTNPADGSRIDLIWSPEHGGYTAILPQSTVSQSQAESRIQEVTGTLTELRTGVIADNRSAVSGGSLRTKLLPEDFFYLSDALKKGTLPYLDLPRVLAMDTDGNSNITQQDLIELIRCYLYQD